MSDQISEVLRSVAIRFRCQGEVGNASGAKRGIAIVDYIAECFADELIPDDPACLAVSFQKRKEFRAACREKHLIKTGDTL